MGADEQYFHGVIDGSDRSTGAKILRAGTACAEPFYSAAMRLRNRLYDAGVFRAHDLGKPTVSIGNITTGGTGKTPVVSWLAEKMISTGRHPAILLRGYKSNATGSSDEQTLLKNVLPSIPVIANPDRRRGALAALSENPQTDLFILDDAMQHRRVRRDLEIVLINATQPFGYSHVLPRGLLREPLSGLGRADIFLITHTSEILPEQLKTIESQLRQHNPNAPTLHTNHALQGFDSNGQNHPLDALSARRYFAFCGIGSPYNFFAQLRQLSGTFAGQRVFADHHDYSKADIESIEFEARAAGADTLICTEKDWVKISRIASRLPIWRAQLSVSFCDDHEQQLLSLIYDRLAVKIST